MGSFQKAINHYKMQNYEIAIMDLLIDLGVQYGQGYYLARPDKRLQFCNKLVVEEIMEQNAHNHIHNHLGVKKYYVKNLVKTGLTVAPHVPVESVLSYMKQHDEIVGICVVEQEQVTAVMTREKLFKRLSGQYGFSLYYKKSIDDLAEKCKRNTRRCLAAGGGAGKGGGAGGACCGVSYGEKDRMRSLE